MIFGSLCWSHWLERHFKSSSGVTVAERNWVIMVVVTFCACLSFCLSVYEAGKAVKKGMGGQYAATLYTPSMYGQPAYTNSLMNHPAIPMLPVPNGVGGVPPHNGYGREFDNASSGWIQCDQVSQFWSSYSSDLWLVFVQWVRDPRCLCCRTKKIAVSRFFSKE